MFYRKKKNLIDQAFGESQRKRFYDILTEDKEDRDSFKILYDSLPPEYKSFADLGINDFAEEACNAFRNIDKMSREEVVALRNKFLTLCWYDTENTKWTTYDEKIRQHILGRGKK